ncbi:MAG: hypothetical protein Q7T22_06685, partial [Serpentinimonas sp.]|nr:hypothetical protein [Serpentinimonas sp.]
HWRGGQQVSQPKALRRLLKYNLWPEQRQANVGASRIGCGCLERNFWSDAVGVTQRQCNSNSL